MKATGKLKEQNGASIVVALLLLLVVTLACSSLYLTISSSIRNAGQGRNREQALILAQSLSVKVKADVQNEESELGQYLMRSVGNGWGYYNPDEVFNSNKASVTRTFSTALETTTESVTEKLDAAAEIAIYWTSDGETETTHNYMGNKRALYVTTTVTVHSSSGDQSASITTVYDYSLKEAGNNECWWTYRGGM